MDLEAAHRIAQEVLQETLASDDTGLRERAIRELRQMRLELLTKLLREKHGDQAPELAAAMMEPTE